MTKFTLSVFDTTGIQNYVFASNRLRENIGASHLVESATHKWVRQALVAPHNLDTKGNILPAPFLEEDTKRQSEVIYRGGGNVVVLFRSLDVAKESTRKLSRIILEHAPGLQIAVAHKEFSWSDPIAGEGGVYNLLLGQLASSKQQKRPSAPLLGQGVTLACRATGLPAVAFDPDDPARALSAEVLAKVRCKDEANKRLHDFLPQEVTQKYALSHDFDDLGRSEGESSYIAVVHADGNGMGNRFRDVANDSSHTDNRAVLEALRDLSAKVEQAGSEALRQTVLRFANHDHHDPQAANTNEGLQEFLKKLKWDGKERKPILPFRPIVFGGDDVTFVCDGRLGLTLGVAYLKAFEKLASGLSGGAAFASAGIAVVKAHYPFARAYQMAEQLCGNAKARLAEDKIQASALDWHFTQTGLTASLDEIRRREFCSADGKPLQMRPLTLKPVKPNDWLHWGAFKIAVEEFNKPEWEERRNKVIALREALRGGADATEQFIVAYNLPSLPAIDSEGSSLMSTGWKDGRCGYFDAIEALDFYLPL